ncbi:DUF421 domain-containing protein [Hymenobacter arizonensis]|uniref:DUF421 domain-containing protein n=1 Tax=Hymenobacter arizonensis TaxID=1227077 RepID=A0A1I5YSX6_HYMAR|nr:YetF domain-containing protein [Hymenobacter arizonensis]SFQ47333.1 Protein of unknown function [Hymenobacter arizonensis]
MEQFFFSNWTSLVRTIVIGTLAYASLILLLRISGKRTLSKMNAFDFVVTVAMGSVLATVLLNKSVPLLDGILAFGLLIGLQFAITWLAVRYKAVSQLVKAEPTLLVYQGQYQHKAMRTERVTEGEILAGLRERGISSLTEAAAVVLETDGTLNVLRQAPNGSQSALAPVSGMPK